jgi:hypothetical protein
MAAVMPRAQWPQRRGDNRSEYPILDDLAAQ